MSKCASCKLPYGKRICKGQEGVCPAGCATAENEALLQTAMAEYEKPELRRFFIESSRQEAAGYRVLDDSGRIKQPIKPRITEIVEFCRRMGYKRLGLAFCGGLREEAAVVETILSAHGFEVESVICKVGGKDKTAAGLEEQGKIVPGKYESMCNPVAQAMILNEAGTEFNVLLGLCVGHDSVFLKYSEAMCTVLAVKDRLLGNNPLACIYTSGMYYAYLKEECE